MRLIKKAVFYLIFSLALFFGQASVLLAQQSLLEARLSTSLNAPPKLIAVPTIEDVNAKSMAIHDDESLIIGLYFDIKPGWKIYWRSPGDAGKPPEWALHSETQNIHDLSFLWPYPERLTLLGLTTMGYGDQVILPIKVNFEENIKQARLKARLDFLICEDICIPMSHEFDELLSFHGKIFEDDSYALTKAIADIPPKLNNPSFLNNIRFYQKENDHYFQFEFDKSNPVLQNIDWHESDIYTEIGDHRPWPAPVFHETEATVFLTQRRNLSKLKSLNQNEMAVFTIQLTKGGGESLIFELSKRLSDIKVDDLIFPEFSTAENTQGGGDISYNILYLLLIAFLGGVILNIMPCVLPVLSLKLSAIAKQGANSKHLYMTAFGILCAFWALAIGLYGLKIMGQAIGWGIQFQSPVFLSVMIMVMVLFMTNLWGLWSFSLPIWMNKYDGGQEKEGLVGSFISGVFATILATPCSTPFLAAAVSFALAGTGLDIILIFTALGFGMAIPFILLALLPKGVRLMPKPGAWLGYVRPISSLLLLATIIWLFYILIEQLDRMSFVIMVVSALLVIMLLMLGKREEKMRLAGFAMVVIAPISLALLLSNDRVNERSDFAQSGSWQIFDKNRLDELRGNKPIFVDVTARWCLTCNWNKANVLDDKQVIDGFKANDFILIRADWTNPDEAIRQYLLSYGRYGIPFNIIYPIDNDPIILPEILNKNDLLILIESEG